MTILQALKQLAAEVLTTRKPPKSIARRDVEAKPGDENLLDVVLNGSRWSATNAFGAALVLFAILLDKAPANAVLICLVVLTVTHPDILAEFLNRTKKEVAPADPE